MKKIKKRMYHIYLRNKTVNTQVVVSIKNIGF